MAFGLGGTEIVIIILIIVILFFGAKKIPELAKGLGRAMGEFKRGRSEVEQEMRSPPAGAARPPAVSADIIKAAQALGIATEGKTEEQLKEEIAQAMKKGA